jgi:PAS domain S-box-containing protein
MDEQDRAAPSAAAASEAAAVEDWSHLGAELLGRLLDELPMPVAVVDPDGSIPFQNRRSRELFGYALDEIPHVEVFRRLVYPDESYRTAVVDRFRAAAESAKNSGDEFRFGPIRMRTRGGGDHEVEIDGTFVGDRLVVVFNDVTDKVRVERALRDGEARLAAAFAAMPDAVALSNAATGQYLVVNEGFCRITGWSTMEAIGKSSADLSLWVDYEQRNEVVRRLVATGRVDDYEASFRRKDGRIITGLVFGRIVKAGEKPLLLTITRDVTEQRVLERRLRESERLDSVGRLAGGVAHDFNNLLTVILGSLELALEPLPHDDPLRPELEIAHQAGERAAIITRQLLAFGRKQTMAARSVDLGNVLSDMEDLLRRVVGEGIEVTLRRSPKVSPVVIDRAQLEQVVLNLVLNARDAMPRGGSLLIETQDVDAATADVDAPGVPRVPGRAVRLTVTDTGTGMTEETRSRIFEPFFSTKERGKGTGLGLSSVYGIVRQSAGTIDVTSEKGRGTTFILDFPASDQSAAPRSERPLVDGRAQPERKRTILVVEDEEAVGHVVRRVLQGGEYDVLLATSGEQAQALAASHAGPIDLLLTDVVMPKMNGPDLAARLLAVRPGLRVLFMSGFPGDTLEKHDIAVSDRTFIQKPFTPAALLSRVAEVLARPATELRSA